MEKHTPLSAAPRAQLLIHAASVGDVAQCRLMVEELEVDINAGDYDGRTPLHLAFAEGWLRQLSMAGDLLTLRC